MDAKSVLLARIQALEKELARARRVVNNDSLVPDLRDRAAPHFASLFDQQFGELNKLQEWVARGINSSDWWPRLLQTRADSEMVFRECGAFLQGIVVRARGLDNRLCAMADALVKDLSQRAQIEWWGLTIPGDIEFVNDLAQIIRLRFADVSIWNLPVVAHEFGHLVAQNLRVHYPNQPLREPFRELLDRRGPKEGPLLHEYFADLFASHALGPSYACTCIMERFNPAAEDIDAEKHPCDGRRAYFVLAVLEKAASSNDPSTGWQTQVNNLRESWRASRKAAGRSEDLDKESQLKVNELVDEMSRLLPYLESAVAYKGWLRALMLEEGLSKEDMPSAVSKNDTFADVLNAAWDCRLRMMDNSYAVRDIGNKAVELYRQVMED